MFTITLNLISKIFIVVGIFSAAIIAIDVIRYPQKKMPIMNIVWPINALWGGLLCLWVYFTLGKHRQMDMSDMPDMPGMSNMPDKPAMSDMQDMPGMPNMSNTPVMSGMPDMPGMSNRQNTPAMPSMPDMRDMPGMEPTQSKAGQQNHSKAKYSSYWQGVVVDTLHCGAGCSLADLLGSLLFFMLPFTLLGSLTFGEWALDYVLALAIGATFQYAAISPMLQKKGGKIWLRALKIDFFSLTSWQVGMYGWMAIVIFAWLGRLSPLMPEFWFMMQIAMCCGFLTAYPMNWWLVKKGIKIGM